MAYSEETVNQKLNTLMETQESICTTANWIIYYRRHAPTIAQIWHKKLKDSPAHKRLNLIYLANEIVQQSKIRKKEDFMTAFSPLIASAALQSYRESPSNIADKIRRVILVWKERSVFPPSLIEEMEQGMDAADKEKAANPGKRSHLSGQRGTANIPGELKVLVEKQQALNGKLAISTINYGQSNGEYKTVYESDSAAQQPPPIQAAKLSNLLKSLDTAHTAVQGAITARKELIDALTHLLTINQTALEGETHRLSELADKKAAVETRKREVEERILKGLDTDGDTNIPGTNAAPFADDDDDEDEQGGRTPEMERPQVEALTPPPADDEYVPPPAASAPAAQQANAAQPGYPGYNYPQNASTPAAQAAQDLLNSLQTSFAQRPPTNTGGGVAQLPGLGLLAQPQRGGEMEGVVGFDGLDAEVLDMLKDEGGGK